MNASLDYDLTIRFYNFSITKDSYDEYVAYRGEHVYGTEGRLEGFDNIRVYSDDSINISYTNLLGLSYEDVRELVKNRVGDSSDTVVCWGDSLTNGTGSTTLKPDGMTADTSYPGALGRLITDEITVINGGVGGEPSWMVAARQVGMSITVEPLTIPADVTPVRVYLKGQEQDYFYDNSVDEWVYSENNLSYNIGVGDTSLVNPCYIDGIEGTLTRELISSGEADPETGETVQSNTYAYYFTRTEAGHERVTFTPKRLITYAYTALRDAINIIWIGQNDAPAHATESGTKYILQGVDRNRIQCMIDILNHKKYIVMDLPSGDDISRANVVQAFNQQFGSHYLNIREYIAKYGVDIANALGANLTISAADQKLIDSGKIPDCLRIDGVHGNYWYYQVVARAVYEKGVDLGYWS
jgi:lysophospholipase L1-like esterase